MLLDLVLLYALFGLGEPAPAEPILIPVAAEDLARCRLTLEQVMAGPAAGDDAPGVTLAVQPTREVRCVLEETGEGSG